MDISFDSPLRVIGHAARQNDELLAHEVPDPASCAYGHDNAHQGEGYHDYGGAGGYELPAYLESHFMLSFPLRESGEGSIARSSRNNRRVDTFFPVRRWIVFA